MKKSKINEKAIILFENLDYNVLYRELFLWLNTKIMVRGIYNIDVDEYIINAIKKLLSGEYKWDVDSYPYPIPVLKKAIWRDIDNEIKKRIRNPIRASVEDPLEIDDAIMQIPDKKKSTMVTDINLERWNSIKEACMDDDEAIYLLEVMESEELYKAKELAEYCDCTVGDIQNIRKRIFRKTKALKLRGEINHG